MLFFQGFARPQLTITIIPEARISALQLWQDDFDGDVAVQTIGFSNGAGVDIDAAWLVPDGGTDVTFANPIVESNLVTRIDEAEAEAIWIVTDQDAFGALELEDEMPPCILDFQVRIEDPWSISRYKQAGTTLDCDTSAPLAGASVFVHNAATGAIIAQGASDGAGAFSVPMFDTGPHFIRAVSGIKTAVSLPVIAETA